MSSAGCYAICAAIMRNSQGSGLKRVDLSVDSLRSLVVSYTTYSVLDHQEHYHITIRCAQNLHVNKDFQDLLVKLHDKYPELQVEHGDVVEPPKRKVPLTPMQRLLKVQCSMEPTLLSFITQFN